MNDYFQGMTSQEKLHYHLDSIINPKRINSEISQHILNHLWLISSQSLWSIQLRDGAKYKKFSDFVDERIATHFMKENSEITIETLKDIVRIVARTLPYAMNHPTLDKKDEVITPQYLIDNVGFGKLKITSSKFEDSTKLNIEQRNQILIDMTILTSKQLETKYTKPLIPPIPYEVNWGSDGTATITIRDLTAEQVDKVRKALS